MEVKAEADKNVAKWTNCGVQNKGDRSEGDDCSDRFLGFYGWGDMQSWRPVHVVVPRLLLLFTEDPVLCVVISLKILQKSVRLQSFIEDSDVGIFLFHALKKNQFPFFFFFPR